jgi:hypothetical protein
MASLRDVTSSGDGQPTPLTLPHLDPIFAAPERYQGEWVIPASGIGAAHLISCLTAESILTACGRRLSVWVAGDTRTAWDGCRRCVAHATLKVAP